MDPGHVLLRRFLRDAFRHVKPGGRIFTSCVYGDPDTMDREEFQSILSDLGIEAKLVYKIAAGIRMC